jgi:hypothetical protein
LVARLNEHTDCTSDPQSQPPGNGTCWSIVEDHDRVSFATSCEHPAFASAEPERRDIRWLLGNHDLEPGEGIGVRTVLAARDSRPQFAADFVGDENDAANSGEDVESVSAVQMGQW